MNSPVYVTMTPSRNGNTTTVKVERVNQFNPSDTFHMGAGQHAGLIINTEAAPEPTQKPEMQLEFTCVMFNKVTELTHAENRRLKFWFTEGVAQFHRLDSSYEFFKTLIDPETFPSDYAGFVKKVMKQMKSERYYRLRRVDVDFITLDQSQDAFVPGQDLSEKETRPVEIIVRENLQTRLEEAYPNVLSMDDLIRILEKDPQMIHSQIEELKMRDIIEEIVMEGKFHGQKGFRRKVLHTNEEVKEVKGANHFQQVSKDEKPTIAVITNLLSEKNAVDSMMENKTTYVRYKTEGESHVYTIGNIGTHKIICTKLPMIGHDLQAKISAGGTTTRLLGAFQEIQHVFVVGVGGSVPHVYEFEKHSRLGDIVISSPLIDETSSATSHMYVYCENVEFPDDLAPPDTPIKFVLKKYTPTDGKLQACVEKVLDRYESSPDDCQWQSYIESVIKNLLEQEIDCRRPPPETDKLKFKIGEGCSFDIKHPDVPADLMHLYREGVPAVRLGVIGSGHLVTTNDALRDTFAMENHLLSYDAEYDQVLESIIGNRLNSYIFIRGMSDYVDGHQGSQWQSYSAIAAAAFMKAVVLQLPK